MFLSGGMYGFYQLLKGLKIQNLFTSFDLENYVTAGKHREGPVWVKADVTRASGP